MSFLNDRREWIECDGLGGFASGTVSGIRTRRYHALLLPATTPPTGRLVLVNGFDAWVEANGTSIPLSSQLYSPNVVHPDGAARIESFESWPWPRWSYRLDEKRRVEHELFIPHGSSALALSWQLRGGGEATLCMRPFLSGRDYHALHHENPGFRFDGSADKQRVEWRPYDGIPAIIALSNGAFIAEPQWYRNFLYSEEQSRGLDCNEDLASPGTFRWTLSRKKAILLLAAEGANLISPKRAKVETVFTAARTAESRRRKSFASPLHYAADAYVVQRHSGRTIIAGYPWFTDWGRDTFIALRGLCLAANRTDVAREILLEWAGTVSEGMLPNRFADQSEAPELNSVDASLWYVIAVFEFLDSVKSNRMRLTKPDRATLDAAVESILDGYANGTRFGIRCDEDGLIAAGQPGVQLTWMDAKVGDWVVTPRIGKPVEIQALWLNALELAGKSSSRWKSLFERGRTSFAERFWNEDARCLYDVVDVDHRPGTVDTAVRPNQILAIGGLPEILLDKGRARRVVDTVDAQLVTPLGLRSLAPSDPQYKAHYEGGVLERDGSYHQGTVWPWLMGPFVEAWLRVRGSTVAARREARRRFLEPLRTHLTEAGIGHVSEIADADAPHTPRGCPFQAWSLGELLRIEAMLSIPARSTRRKKHK
jgi:predicted glycogen debranching enzyme